MHIQAHVGMQRSPERQIPPEFLASTSLAQPALLLRRICRAGRHPTGSDSGTACMHPAVFPKPTAPLHATGAFGKGLKASSR